MSIEREDRKKFSLLRAPAKTYYGRRVSGHEPTPLFNPLPEELPQESGYYTYTIDSGGRFRVMRGHTGSHAKMTGNIGVGAAGYYRIARSGKVAMVYCGSLDFWIRIPTPRHNTVEYVIDAFKRHPSFDLSEYIYFNFLKIDIGSFNVDIAGNLINDEIERSNLADQEEVGKPTGQRFGGSKVALYSRYTPVTPPRLYTMYRDQTGVSDSEDDWSDFTISDPMPPYSPQDGLISAGKVAFVLDRLGWLILGSHHHYILSGGHSVGAAGQLHINSKSEVFQVNLNFSGHYRPPLTPEYACYTYSVLHYHPLLIFTSDCIVTGRKSFASHAASVINFEAEDLLLGNSIVADQIAGRTNGMGGDEPNFFHW